MEVYRAMLMLMCQLLRSEKECVIFSIMHCRLATVMLYTFMDVLYCCSLITVAYYSFSNYVLLEHHLHNPVLNVFVSLLRNSRVMSNNTRTPVAIQNSFGYGALSHNINEGNHNTCSCYSWNVFLSSMDVWVCVCVCVQLRVFIVSASHVWSKNITLSP